MDIEHRDMLGLLLPFLEYTQLIELKSKLEESVEIEIKWMENEFKTMYKYANKVSYEQFRKSAGVQSSNIVYTVSKISALERIIGMIENMVE